MVVVVEETVESWSFAPRAICTAQHQPIQGCYDGDTVYGEGERRVVLFTYLGANPWFSAIYRAHCAKLRFSSM